MGPPFRSWARLSGSLAVLFGDITVISADLETAIFLVASCLLGVACWARLSKSDWGTTMHSTVGPTAARVVGVLSAVALIAIVAAGIWGRLWGSVGDAIARILTHLE